MKKSPTYCDRRRTPVPAARCGQIQVIWFTKLPGFAHNAPCHERPATLSLRRSNFSQPLSRAQYVSQETKGLLDRLFGGRVAPLIAHFSEQRKLSKKDVAELRKLLQELDDEQH